jgi:hypothetical protein
MLLKSGSRFGGSSESKFKGGGGMRERGSVTTGEVGDGGSRSPAKVSGSSCLESAGRRKHLIFLAIERESSENLSYDGRSLSKSGLLRSLECKGAPPPTSLCPPLNHTSTALWPPCSSCVLE